MKRILLCVLICLMLLCACGEQSISTEVGETVFGAFSAMDLEGNLVDETVFAHHKLTMVNIWATTCGPCVEEMPDLAKVNDAFGDDFQVIGIPLDAADRNGQIIPEKKGEAASLIETTGAKYRHILPSPTLQKVWLTQVQSVPQTVFVNAQGQQVGQVYMGAKSRKDWEKIIKTLLESME